ncbi:DUF6252 family protein [Flavobacterium sp. UBA7680]|uniref:DUF6252 family protein n=1 Tax=Flavobacterium sp. UBA7680 TaxID=1946559 RepID=UPI0025C242F3|nr:DUF6252 family protein [Flavobacterium sp. UBA7680]
MMKKICVLFISILTVGSIFSSCNSDEFVENEKQNEILDVAAPGTLQCDFDNKTFVSTSVQAFVGDNYVSITALRSTKGDRIQIILPSNKLGTYTWKSGEKGGFAITYSPISTEYSSFISGSKETIDHDFGVSDYEDTASVTITAIDAKSKKISGTFQFTGVRFDLDALLRTKKITNGSFNEITFKDDTSVLGNNSFAAKLDGVNFNPTNISGSLISGYITVVAKSSDFINIKIKMPSTIKGGGNYNYSTVSNEDDILIEYNDEKVKKNMFILEKGTIDILSHDTARKTIIGTFTASFKPTQPDKKHEITDGVFNISY